MSEQNGEITAEQVDLLRNLLLSRGWQEVLEPIYRAQIELVKNQTICMEDERHEKWKKMSTERLSGFVLGLGWAHKIALQIVTVANARREAQRQDKERAALEDQSMGHPYVEEPTMQQ